MSLATLVLSRIDTLAESPRKTLKLASVVGRHFGVDLLIRRLSRRRGRRQVTGYLRSLCSERLVVHEEPEVDRLRLPHAVIREVAYDSLPFAFRAVLHGRIGRWLELTAPGLSTCWPITSGTAPTPRKSATTSSAPARLRRRAMPTSPPSTTSDASPACSLTRSEERSSASWGLCSSSEAIGQGRSPRTPRRSSWPTSSATRAQPRGCASGAASQRAGRAATTSLPPTSTPRAGQLPGPRRRPWDGPGRSRPRCYRLPARRAGRGLGRGSS